MLLRCFNSTVFSSLPTSRNLPNYLAPLEECPWQCPWQCSQWAIVYLLANRHWDGDVEPCQISVHIFPYNTIGCLGCTPRNHPKQHSNGSYNHYYFLDDHWLEKIVNICLSYCGHFWIFLRQSKLTVLSLCHKEKNRPTRQTENQLKLNSYKYNAEGTLLALASKASCFCDSKTGFAFTDFMVCSAGSNSSGGVNGSILTTWGGAGGVIGTLRGLRWTCHPCLMMTDRMKMLKTVPSLKVIGSGCVYL